MLNKTTFITKSLCYHQIELADELYKLYGKKFCFIQMRKPLDFRVQYGQEGFERPYLKTLDSETEECLQIIKESKAVIIGEAPSKLIKMLDKKCCVLKYSERIYKRGYSKFSFIHFILSFLNLVKLKLFIGRRKSFLLAAGGYAVNDYNGAGLFKKNSFKFGYFPKLPSIDFDELKKAKNGEVINLIWVSRLLKWKHPEYVISLANFLKHQEINFNIEIIGDGDDSAGEMKKKIQDDIIKYHLEDCVKMLGKHPQKFIFEQYKKADIALFTSSSAEGWGVGISEAGSLGCAVVASNEMGSATYLLRNNISGIVFNRKKISEFNNSVLDLCLNENKRLLLAKTLHSYLTDKWTPKKAAISIYELIELNKVQLDGPCSKASKIKKGWYKYD